MCICVVGLFKGTMKVHGNSAGACDIFSYDTVLAVLVGAGD
jgi:hypothetical protein